jgi:heptosyltransferase I
MQPAALFPNPPATVCLLRLSAIGDTCHVVPLLRTLQHAWPETRFTWVIGRIEARLMSLLPEIEFITVDKRSLWDSRASVRNAIGARRFDLLLHLQTSFRASLYSTAIAARVRLGYDRARARELQWLFTNARIAPRTDQHSLDAYLGFADALGIGEHRIEWNVPVPAAARQWASEQLPGDAPTLLISPCSSHRLRSWRPERYAAVAAHAVTRHGMRVLLCGAPTDYERGFAADIERTAGVPVVNLVGRDTLPQLLALLERVTVVLTPDSGPAHMATMVGTPVIGLYAATRVRRTGPYLSQKWCVDRYAAAARRFRGKTPSQLKWTEYIEEPGVMDLIEVADVNERLDALQRESPSQHSRRSHLLS